jgi:hypothetical protein
MVPSENEEPPMSTPLDTELGQKGSTRKGQEVLEPVYPNSCMCRECCLRLIAYRGEHAEGVDGGDWGGDPDGVREVAVFGMACERQTLPAQKDRFSFPRSLQPHFGSHFPPRSRLGACSIRADIAAMGLVVTHPSHALFSGSRRARWLPHCLVVNCSGSRTMAWRQVVGGVFLSAECFSMRPEPQP